MGLAITAYSKLKYVGDHPFDPELNEGEPGPWCYYEQHVQASAYAEFPDSFRGIPVIRERTGSGGTKFLEGGCFELTADTQTHGFRAGSYTSYNRWREDLASQFNPAPMGFDHGPYMKQPDPDKPFYELIWFADNEGCIGELAAVELLADFRSHAERYVDPYTGYGRQSYDNWTRAFELAADGGLVRFH